jgi:hypothetical protein
MPLTLATYKGVDNTLVNIFKLINAHYKDDYLKVFDSWSLEQIFNYIKRVPYVPDPVKVPISNNDDIELLKSPYFTIYTGGDCDDKAILAGSILKRKGIPFRFAVVTNSPFKDYHHIYPEIYLGVTWVPFDATYNHNKIFDAAKYVKKKTYSEINGKIETKVYSKMLAGNNSLNGTKLALLQGSGLGFDVASVVGAALGIITAIFSGKPKPPNINYAFQQMEKEESSIFTRYGNVFASDQAMQELAAVRSMMAVFLDKYGLVPAGKAKHDVWPDVEWSSVQSEIEQKAAQLLPFMLWIQYEDKAGRWAKGYEQPARLKQIYVDFKNQSGDYLKFLNATQNQKKTKQSAGINTNTLLILGLIGAGIYLLAE